MFIKHQMDEGCPMDMMDWYRSLQNDVWASVKLDALGLTMSIYKNCPIWLNISTAAAYISRSAFSIKWVNQYMISCSVSNSNKSRAMNLIKTTLVSECFLFRMYTTH